MTDSVMLAIVGIIPSTLAAVLGYMNNKRIVSNHIGMTKNLDNLTKNTNGKMDRLLELTGTSEYARGKLDQKDAEL